jgi:type IV pilus assembly protein PilA
MLSSIKQRLDREDEGFTLIELMVVVLIIAILLAIAIPTFLGARNTANARAAESTLRNALTAEQTYFTNNNQVFGGPTAVSSIEPNIQFTGTAPSTSSPNPNLVYVDVPTGATDTVFLQTAGNDHNCYTIYQSDASTSSVTAYAVTSGACDATTAPTTVSSGSASQNAGKGFYTSW